MKHHWQTLEYPQILDRLAEYADFSGGRALALDLEPTPHLREAQEQLALTREALALTNLMPDFALGGIYDIRPLAAQARHGIMLPPSDFLQVRGTLLSAARIRRLLTRLEMQFAALADIAWRIHDLPALVEAIAQVLDERGEIRDHASPELARIRRDMHIAQDRIQDRLRRIISSPDVQPYLQDALVTRREGRFVIPVQADFKGHVKGVVHDRSSSGATLFMEPLQVVTLNNSLRELRLAEEDEIRALLRALTLQVADSADEIAFTLDALSELDLALAKARYALHINATEVQFLPIPEFPPKAQGDNAHPGTTIQLKSARHPLLDPEQVVPVDVLLDAQTHVLIITGPNTGGKTVTLKTVGLLTLMAQAGMFIPVDEGSSLSCFATIVADIGDEQSIEQSLSTFSSHLTNIVTFLETVDHRALVLLDELGAGTDPAEGAALARALLDAFRARRCTALVATHYPELKLYAHNVPGVRNASMAFDVETLAPTYHLNIGLPGRSNAFAIARRLGLAAPIIKQAQGMLSGEALSAEDMLDDLHNLRLQQVKTRDVLRQEKQEALALNAELRARLLDIEKERQQVLQIARATAQEKIAALREELRALRSRLLAAPGSEVGQTLNTVEREIEDLDVTFPEPEPLVADLIVEVAPEPVTELGVGDTVRLLSLNIQGTVVALDGADIVVQAGVLRTRVAREDVVWLHSVPPPRVEADNISTKHRFHAPSPGVQIDLRGQTVHEALERLDRYLDRAVMAALPWVRIVHGKGTGKLRHAVRRFMGEHPLVVSYEAASRNEGGEGATVAHLATAQ